MSSYDQEQAEKIGYLMRAIEELSTFVQQHMTQEEVRFSSVESKIASIDKKLNIMFIVGGAVLGALGGKQAVLFVISLFA